MLMSSAALGLPRVVLSSPRYGLRAYVGGLLDFVVSVPRAGGSGKQTIRSGGYGWRMRSSPTCSTVIAPARLSGLVRLARSLTAFMGSAAAGGDDFALSARPVVNDSLARNWQGFVGVDVVEVSETKQDVVDCLVGVFWLEAFNKQCQAFIDRATCLLLDGHEVEIVAELAAIAYYFELHRYEVANLSNAKPIDLRGDFEQPLRSQLVRMQELHSRGGEHPVKRAWRAFGDRKGPSRGQLVGQLVQIDAVVVEEEI